MALKKTYMYLVVGLNFLSMNLSAELPHPPRESAQMNVDTKSNLVSSINASECDKNFLIKTNIIKDYFLTWEVGDYQKLTQMFSPDATIEFPIYGSLTVPQLIKKFLNDTLNGTKFSIKHIFMLPDDPNVIAVDFIRMFPIKGGGMEEGEVFTIYKFNPQNKIESAKVFHFDTEKLREAIKKNQSSS